MDELKMTGNCLKGSRPLLSFDKGFEERPHFALIKEMFTQMFGVPRLARRSKPFIDHVLSFSVLDNKVWLRHYQIVEKDSPAAAGADAEGGAKKRTKGKDADAASTQPTLVEIGPRMVMTPIRIFEGSFGGPTVYENPGDYRERKKGGGGGLQGAVLERGGNNDCLLTALCCSILSSAEYLSPNTVRHLTRRKKGEEYKDRTTASLAREAKRQRLEANARPNELSRERVFA